MARDFHQDLVTEETEQAALFDLADLSTTPVEQVGEDLD